MSGERGKTSNDRTTATSCESQATAFRLRRVRRDVRVRSLTLYYRRSHCRLRAPDMRIIVHHQPGVPSYETAEPTGRRFRRRRRRRWPRADPNLTSTRTFQCMRCTRGSEIDGRDERERDRRANTSRNFFFPSTTPPSCVTFHASETVDASALPT